MGPALLQMLGPEANFIAVAVLLQIGMVLFVTGRRFLTRVCIAAVSLAGGIFGGSFASATIPSMTVVMIVSGLVGGFLLGAYLRPVGVGLVLAYLGYLISNSVVDMSLAQYVVAMDLFAYGLFLTDLAPTLVSSLLASSILLLSAVWAGASGPAAIIIASAGGGARLMASYLPSWFALRAQGATLT
jgi:hypothetical protein